MEYTLPVVLGLLVGYLLGRVVRSSLQASNAVVVWSSTARNGLAYTVTIEGYTDDEAEDLLQRVRAKVE